MSSRLNKEVPPLKSEKPIFNERASKKAMWTYKSDEELEGYQGPINKTQAEMIYAMTEMRKSILKLIQ